MFFTYMLTYLLNIVSISYRNRKSDIEPSLRCGTWQRADTWHNV